MPGEDGETGAQHDDVGRPSLRLGAASKALGAVQGTVSPNSALYFQLNDTLRQIALAATEIRVFAAYLQRNPNALLTGKR